MQNFILTTNDDVKNSKDYKNVIGIVNKLIEGGVTFAARGYCISMSDVVYTLLRQNKIPCKIVECHLAISSKTSNKIHTVGFDGLKDDPNKADTHVVVVTETETPLIIDLSIAHMLPNNLQGVVDGLVDDKHGGIFADIDSPVVALTYQKKKEFSIPMLHQRSIVDRIQTDVNIFKNLTFLKYAVLIALLVSTISASRGFYDYYETYIHDNNWGPSGMEKLMNKIDKLDAKVTQLEKK